MIRIDAIIIELDQKLGVEIDVAVDEVKRVKQSKEAIAIITRNAQENLMRRLLDSGAGKVVSRPKIMTTSGRSATVEVGQEVLASSPGNTLVAPRQIGLRLHCRPVLTGQMLHMEVECENSKLNDQNAIEVQKLETAMELSSGETLMLSGVGNNRLMVFLTPQVLPLQFTQSDLAVNTEPIAATTALPP